MQLIQVGEKTFIPSDAKITQVSFYQGYPVGVGTLRLRYITSLIDGEKLVDLTTAEDQKIALTLIQKMTTLAVNTTPEVDFWVNVNRKK